METTIFENCKRIIRNQIKWLSHLLRRTGPDDYWWIEERLEETRIELKALKQKPQ